MDKGTALAMVEDSSPASEASPYRLASRSAEAAREVARQIGHTRLGVLKNWEWYDDPRRLLFSGARYKFVAKMFAGRESVLEAGCGDAFCAPIVLQTVKKLTVVDFDPLFIADARARMKPPWIFETRVVDVSREPLPGVHDAIYSLDVVQLVRGDQDQVIRRIADALSPQGAAIIGIPSLESLEYAATASKVSNIGCKTEEGLRAAMARYFDNVFMFGMNDEVVHTGFGPMAHYRLALACNPRRP